MTDAGPEGSQGSSGLRPSELEPIDFGAVGWPTLTLTVGERIALGTHKLRVRVAMYVTTAFIVINGLVMYGLYSALRFDFRMIEANHNSYKPFVTESVIMSLLGATTIQLGAIMLAMAKFLFPTRPNGS